MAASLPMEQDPIQVHDHCRPHWQDTSDNQSYPIGKLIGKRRSSVIHEDFIPVCQDLLDSLYYVGCLKRPPVVFKDSYSSFFDTFEIIFIREYSNHLFSY